MPEEGKKGEYSNAAVHCCFGTLLMGIFIGFVFCSTSLSRFLGEEGGADLWFGDTLSPCMGGLGTFTLYDDGRSRELSCSFPGLVVVIATADNQTLTLDSTEFDSEILNAQIGFYMSIIPLLLIVCTAFSAQIDDAARPMPRWQANVATLSLLACVGLIVAASVLSHQLSNFNDAQPSIVIATADHVNRFGWPAGLLEAMPEIEETLKAHMQVVRHLLNLALLGLLPLILLGLAAVSCIVFIMGTCFIGFWKVYSTVYLGERHGERHGERQSRPSDLEQMQAQHRVLAAQKDPVSTFEPALVVKRAHV